MVTPAENFLNRKSVGFTSRRGLRDLCALAVQNSAASDSGVYPVRAGVVQNQLSQSSTYDQLNRLTGNTRRGAANQSWTLDTDNVLSRQEPKSRLSAGAAHREISQDPAGYINGANTYQFVMSNPVGNVDPNGRSTASIPPGLTSNWPLPPSGYQQLQQYQSAAQDQLNVINALEGSMSLFTTGSPEWNTLNGELTQAQSDFNAIQADETNALMGPLPLIQPNNGGGGNGDVCL